MNSTLAQLLEKLSDEKDSVKKHKLLEMIEERDKIAHFHNDAQKEAILVFKDALRTCRLRHCELEEECLHCSRAESDCLRTIESAKADCHDTMKILEKKNASPNT